LDNREIGSLTKSLKMKGMSRVLICR